MIKLIDSNLFLYELALALSIILTAFSQVLLRLGAKNKMRPYDSFLNIRSFCGYSLFFIVVLLMIFAMQKIQLKTAVAWNSLTYVFTPLAARVFAKDPLNLKIVSGSAFIVLGILIFSM